MSNIGQLLKKIPEYQKKAELHDEITIKILEIVNEINIKLEEIEKCLKSK